MTKNRKARKNKKKKNQKKLPLTPGLAGFIAIQLIFSTVTPIGSLMINSKNKLADFYAAALNQEKRQNILDQRDRKMASPAMRELKRICEQDKQAIKTASPQNYDFYIIKAHGSYADTKRLGVTSTPKSSCGKVEVAVKEIQDQTTSALEDHDRFESQGLPSVVVLQRAYPETYDNEFDRDGTIADGNTAIRVATQYMVDSIVKGEISRLGSSLFVFCLSLATSGTTIFLLIAHTNNKDIIASFCKGTAQIVHSFFSFYSDPFASSATEEEKNAILSYYEQHVLEGGVVRIPSLQAYVALAHSFGLHKRFTASAAAAEAAEANKVVDRSSERRVLEAVNLRDRLDTCVYAIRRVLHTLATSTKPYSYRQQMGELSPASFQATVTTDSLISGDAVASDELGFILGQYLRKLRSIVDDIRVFALDPNDEDGSDPDLSTLTFYEHTVFDLLSPDRLQSQLARVDKLQPQNFLLPRLESLDRLQSEAHQCLKMYS